MLHPVNRLPLKESHLKHMLQQFLHMALTVMELLAAKILTFPQAYAEDSFSWSNGRRGNSLDTNSSLSFQFCIVNACQNNPNMFFSCQISLVASCFWICDAAFHAHTCTEICPHAPLHSFTSFPIPAGSGSNLELRAGPGTHTQFVFFHTAHFRWRKKLETLQSGSHKQHQSYSLAQPQTFHPFCSRNNKMPFCWCFFGLQFVLISSKMWVPSPCSSDRHLSLLQTA